MSVKTLFSHCMRKCNVTTHSALAERVGSSAAILSRTYHSDRPVSPTLILCIHETLDIPIKEIRELIAQK